MRGFSLQLTPPGTWDFGITLSRSALDEKSRLYVLTDLGHSLELIPHFSVHHEVGYPPESPKTVVGMELKRTTDERNMWTSGW